MGQEKRFAVEDNTIKLLKGVPDMREIQKLAEELPVRDSGEKLTVSDWKKERDEGLDDYEDQQVDYEHSRDSYQSSSDSIHWAVL